MMDNSSLFVGSRNGMWGPGGQTQVTGVADKGAHGAQSSISLPGSMEVFQIYPLTIGTTIQVCPSRVALVPI